MKITKECNLFKDETISINGKLNKNDTVKFYKTSTVVHKIMITKKLKGSEYEFKNVYPVFSDTIVEKNTEIISGK